MGTAVEKGWLMPPRPTLRVAVVGHVAVAADSALHLGAARRVFEGLNENLAKFEGGYAHEGPARLVVLGSLAPGADLLLARAAVDAGAVLQVVLPFSPEEFAEDFKGRPTELELHKQLLKRADRLFVHDGRRGDGACSREADMRKRAYREAGRTLIRHCDLLVAIWNGEPQRGIGGTAEQIELALTLGIPVLWIRTGARTDHCNPCPPARAGAVADIREEPELRWLKRPYDRWRWPEPPDPGALPGELASQVKRILELPGAEATHHRHGLLGHPLGFLEGPEPSQAEQLEAFLNEFGSSANGSKAVEAEEAERRRLESGARARLEAGPSWLYDQIGRLIFTARSEETVKAGTDADLRERFERASMAEVWADVEQGNADHSATSQPDRVAATFEAVLEGPDTRSRSLARAFRGIILLVTTLAALAIVCAAVALACPEYKTKLAILELVILLGVMGIVHYANKNRLKDRWQHYRLVAELLRINAALAPFGRTLPMALTTGEAHVGGAVPKWVPWYVNAVIRDIGLASQNHAAAATRVAIASAACHNLLLGQIHYHRRNAARTARFDSAADGAGQWLAVLTVAVILVKLLVLPLLAGSPEVLAAALSDPGRAPPKDAIVTPLGNLLTLLTVVMPVIAASMFALRQVEEWAFLAQRSKSMAESLTATLVHDLAPTLGRLKRNDQCDSLVMVDAANGMLRVGRDMVGEVGNWLAIVDVKRVEGG